MIENTVTAALSPPPRSPESPIERVQRAYREIAAADRPEIWVHLRPEAAALTDAAAVERRTSSGEELPLAGLVLAVKDNIDVAGLPTTAGHPAFARVADVSATAVERLVAAGAVVVGKTALDQFATGLVGTRSPWGPVRSARRPERVSGGSSSGSGAAVGLGLVDLALATDTAGSGRVPAAFNGVVGIKGTVGLVPVDGVVPACPSYDCVTILAPTLPEASRAMAVLAGPSAEDPTSRPWPATAPLSAPSAAVIAVPSARDLAALSPQARARFAEAVARAVAAGARTRTIDLSPFLAAARLLYDGGLVAERFASYGPFLLEHPDGADPSVERIVRGAQGVPGYTVVRDQQLLRRLRATAMASLDGCDALLVPTSPIHPTIAEVAADPIGVNSLVGTFTNFVNLFDLAAVAVPAGEADGGLFGVTVVTRAFADQVAVDLAGDLLGEPRQRSVLPPGGVPLVVFGAHLRGEPLSAQLEQLGARYVRDVVTAPDYAMFLTEDGSRPVVAAVGPGAGDGVPGEEWILSSASLGALLPTIPAPLAVGKVRLADGRSVLGFTGAAVAGEQRLPRGWRAYRESLERDPVSVA